MGIETRAACGTRCLLCVFFSFIYVKTLFYEFVAVFFFDRLCGIVGVLTVFLCFNEWFDSIVYIIRDSYDS